MVYKKCPLANRRTDNSDRHLTIFSIVGKAQVLDRSIGANKPAIAIAKYIHNVRYYSVSLFS